VVSALVSGSSGPDSSSDLGDCIVFLVCKTLDSHSASLHPVVEMGTGKFNAGGNPGIAYHPGRRRMILLAASCYRNRTDKRRPDGPLGSYADFTFLPTLACRRYLARFWLIIHFLTQISRRKMKELRLSHF